MNSTLSGKNILVTGATGFIGSRLAEQLSIREQAAVTGLGRTPDRLEWLQERSIDAISLDILDTDALEEVTEGKDIVFHTVGITDPDPEKAHKVNVNATENLVRFAGASGVSRFVHISTVGVYDMEGLSEVKESTPLALDHPATYPRTKARAEERAFELAEEVGIELAVVRPSMVYGPGPGLWTVTMFNNIRQGKPVFLGDGSANFNPVYIDDVVEALILCAKSPQAPGQAFNLSAEITTWREFMERYGKLCDKEPKGLPLWLARLMAFANKIPGVSTPVDQGFIEMATSKKRFPTDKARKMLGWEPKVELEEGFQQTARWLEEQGYLD